MNKGKTIFSQIMSLIPERDFKTCVDRYKGNYRARNFSCKDQFLVMSYAQLTGRDSLRDIENCLTALSSKLYHCGISYAVPRNTLAKANEKRDWHIYKDFADVLLKKVRPLYAKDKFRLDLANMVYAFDSSTISLCLKLCPWAKFRKNKGGIKMHTLVDLRGNLPVSVYLTSASVNDVKALDNLYIEPSAIYLMDRGYIDFNRLFKLITKQANAHGEQKPGERAAQRQPERHQIGRYHEGRIPCFPGRGQCVFFRLPALCEGGNSCRLRLARRAPP